jgi:hypothetical protein
MRTNKTRIKIAMSLIENSIHDLVYLQSIKGRVTKKSLNFHTKYAAFKLRTALSHLRTSLIDETDLNIVSELLKQTEMNEYGKNQCD